MQRKTFVSASACCALALGLTACTASEAPDRGSTPPPQANNGVPPATPKAVCGPGSRPEPGLQGRLSQADIDSGLALQGITCNTELVGAYTTPNNFASVGGWKVERYVDASGRECAYYDATSIFPLGILDGAVGVNVMDMSDPSNPTLSTRLLSPAMLSPHESMLLSESRGLLIAVNNNSVVGPVFIDIYDLTQDCRRPALQSSSLLMMLGHESGLSPDGMTFFSATPVLPTLTAVDISDPSHPQRLWSASMNSHGLSVSADGNRAYVTDASGKLRILDVSQIQDRTPNPEVPIVSELTWGHGSIPQNAIAFSSGGTPFLLEFDEFGAGSRVGAARIIDLSDETSPEVVSNLRLEVHQPENFREIARDPNARNPAGGYSAHYCDVPTRVDPPIAACSMILSGLRIFDIRDPYNPREVAYFNAPLDGAALSVGPGSAGAYSKPAFVPERKEIWYSDSSSGFFAIRVTNGAWP